jgi:hypothetical protein
MNLFAYIFAVVGLIGMCSHPPVADLATSDKVMSSQLGANRFSVIVVIDEISPSAAKNMAKQRAAEVTVENGYRYFTMEDESEVQVVKAQDLGYQRFGGNAYQEVIMQRNFGRDQVSGRNQMSPQATNYQAIRVVFSAFKDKPKGPSVDACKLTKCE